MAINAIVRATRISKNTILKLLADLGNAWAIYQYNTFRNLPCKRLELDEIWSFCFAKQRNVPANKEGVFGYGDVYTWVAIDAETKLVPSWYVGRRDGESAMEFVKDLASRLANRVQITTDGHKPYLEAIEEAFGSEVDYAMLLKLYGGSQDEVRYSPANFVASKKERIVGNPRARVGFNVLCRETEFDNAHVDATLHATDKRAQQKDRKTYPRDSPALHVL